MVAERIVNAYAIGGAVAAVYYLEPFATADLDVFVQVNTSGNDFTLLAPIYEYLLAAGHTAQGEFVYIAGVPVQFLPVFNPLTDEAVMEAVTVPYGRETARIMRPEHLVAIMIDTGRAKDYMRISMFLEQKAVDVEPLNALLEKHGLMQKWRENQRRFQP